MLFGRNTFLNSSALGRAYGRPAYDQGLAVGLLALSGIIFTLPASFLASLLTLWTRSIIIWLFVYGSLLVIATSAVAVAYANHIIHGFFLFSAFFGSLLSFASPVMVWARIIDKDEDYFFEDKFLSILFPPFLFLIYFIASLWWSAYMLKGGHGYRALNFGNDFFGWLGVLHWLK
jgi:hypothetical protein